MMTREHHRRRSPESERRRRKERRSSREQVLGNLPHIPEPDRYQTTNTMRQEPSGSSHAYYESQPAAQRSSYYAPPPAPSQSHYGQSRARSSSSNSSSSSTSSSLLNISRRSKAFGLKSFFTAASEKHKRRVRKQRSRRMFRFGNGSSSSDLSDMAYGRGYIDRRKSRDFTPPGPHRRGETSDSGARPGLPKRAQTDEEIIELGRKFAEIARHQNKEDQRRAGRHKTPALLGAAAALSAFNKTSGSGRSERGVGSSKHSRHDSSDESEWESASEDESSSEDEDLVYGSAVNLPTGGHQSIHQSIHIHSPSTTGPRSEYDRMLQHKPSIVDPNRFGPVNSLRGYVNSPCGFDKVDRRTVNDSFQGHLPGEGSSSVSQSETVLFEGRPMQNVYPVPTSDPNVYKTSRGSIVEQDSRGRPAPVPIQQPKPIVPVPSKVYDTTDVDARYSKRPSSSGTALAGAAAAGLAGAAIASALSDRKDKDKEDRRGDRDSRRERDSEKERDRELEREERRRLRRSDPKYAESMYSESRYGDEKDEKRRSKRSDDKSSGSKYADSQIGDNRDEKRRSKRSDDKYSHERDEKRKSPDDDRDLDRAERRREKERLRELEKEALTQSMNADRGLDRENGKQIKDRDYQLEYGREYRGLERREDRKKEKERREDKSIASRSSDAESYRRIEDLNDPSARGPIDPFQFQVANDAFATPQRPLTPSIVTVNREPDFANMGNDYIRPIERLSRKDSYERELRNAGAIYDGTRTATAPIAAGAIAAATAAVGLERSRGRSRSRGGDESSRVREDHNDVVQDVANILYRRDVLARQAAEDRSRSESPDHSVVDKWKAEPESSKSGITTPPAIEMSKPKSPYDGPDADVRIDRILSPDDLPLRPNGRPFKSRDPSAERERPMLNIVRPTPVPTPQPEWQQAREEYREQAPEEKESRKDSKKKKRKNPPLVEQIRAASEVGTSTRSEVTSTPSTPTSKGVTWGENETRRYVVESPERGHDELSGSRVVVPAEKPTPKSGKKSGWGILTSAIAGAGAAAATSALSDSGKDQDAEETSSRVSSSSKKSRDRDSPREKDVDRFETSSNISSSSRKSKDRDSPKEKDIDRFETTSNISSSSRKSKDRDSARSKDRDVVSSVISSSSRKSRDRDSAEYDDRTRDDITSNISSSSRKSRDRDVPLDRDDGASHVSNSSKKSRDSPPRDKRSSFVPWDEAEEPPVPGPKPSGSRGSPMPGSFAEDLAFTATIAAGLQDSGFDPNIVIDDAKYHRRDSPPNATGKPHLYESPFAETVSDLGKYPVEATGSNIGQDTGFILGEIPETPQEERDLPSDSVDLSKLGKKERKKLGKAAKRASVDNYDDLKSQIVVQEESEASQAPIEPIAREQDEWAPTEKLSKKEQKKRDKARAKALQEEESALSTPRDSEPETLQQVQDEDEWATSSKLSKKEKKKLEKAAKAKALEDEVVEPSTPQQSEPQATEPTFDEWEDSYSSKKSKKDKKNKSLDWVESPKNFDDATESKITVPVDAFRDIQEEAQYAQPEDDWSVSSKKSKKSKRDSGALDWAAESAPPTGEDSHRSVQDEASFGQPEDAWSTSSKKSKKKSKRDSEIFESAIQTPLPAEETSRDFAEESSTVQPEDDWSAPTSKKSKKKSKRNSEIYESPSQSMILPEPEVSRDTQSSIGAPFDDDWNISPKKSKKKSKRDSGAYDSPSRSAAQSEVGESSYRTGEAENTPLPEDDWDAPKKSRKHSKQDSFATDNTDWTNVPSVVSESMHKSRSTDDFSITEPAGGDDWEVPVKKSKKKSKRDSKSYDSPSQTANEADDGAASPKAMTDSFADVRSEKGSGPLDDEWNESKKSKKSKRHSIHESLPEPEYGSETSERKSKKEKRRSLPGGFPDEFDGLDQGDPPDRGRDDYPFVDNDVSSVVSAPHRDRSEKRKSRSRLDDLDDDAKSIVSAPGGSRKSRSRLDDLDDDAKSIASAPGGSRKRDSKSEKDKEKRNSTGSGFFDRFKSSIGIVDDKTSRDEDKKSLKDNAGTLGASVGLLGAAAALVKSQMSPTKATDVPSEEKEVLSDHITPSRQQCLSPSQRRPYDSIDPEIVEREIRPAIDPQYGDFLPLPPSPPPGPETTHETDELPALPDSRPETPEQERQLRREMLNRPPSHIRRKSANETPTKMKSPSQSAIPLRFGIGKGKRLSEPPSPVMRRVTPVSSPIATPTETLSAGKARPARPTSWDSTREFKPLYLVEKTSRDSVVPPLEHADDLPQIPESLSSSRASLDPETDAQYEHAPKSHDGPLGLDIPVTSAETDPLQLGSEETTPTARDLPDALATSQQAEQQLEEPSFSSLPENKDQPASKTDLADSMPTDLKDEIPSAENVGLGLMTDVPAASDAVVSILDDSHLPVDDGKVEAGPSEFSDVTSKKSKKGKKNKKALDWEPEPESATIPADDVPTTSVSHIVPPAEESTGLSQDTEPQQEVKSDPQTPTLKPTMPLTEDVTESAGLGPEPESVYATPMDTEAVSSAGFTFPEPVATERGVPIDVQEPTETVTHPVTTEELQTHMSEEPALPTKKGKKKKKGKKSLSWEPEPELQPEAESAPGPEVANTSTAASAPGDDAIIATESTPDNNQPISLATREVEDLQQPLVASLPEDTPLSPALEPQRSDMLHSPIPLEDQSTADTSGLETANVEMPSPDHTSASMVADPQAESREITETSTVKAADNDAPHQDVVAEPLQLDLAHFADPDPSASLQDPLPTADPSDTAIDHSAQPLSPRSLEDKKDLVAAAEDVPVISEQVSSEPLDDPQQEVGGKKKKKDKKGKKRQSVSWEPEPELPTEVPLPEDTGPSEPLSEALSPSNELPPSTQPEMEAAADDLWSAPAKSGKKGKKARQSEVLDDAGPSQESEPPAASLLIDEESRDQPTEPDLGNQPSSSTNWAEEVEESLPAVSEPEPSQTTETTETDPQAEFTVSKKKSKKDKKKNRASVQFDDDLGEAPVEQTQNEVSTQEPTQDISAPLTSDSPPSSNAERDISEPAPEKEITDDLWPTSSKKSKKKKKGQLVQWDDVTSTSEPPQESQESDAPNVELPAGTSDEHLGDAVSTQDPANLETQLQPGSGTAPDTVFGTPEEQPHEIAKEPEVVADLVHPETSQVQPEHNVPVETPEGITPANHAISQVEGVAPLSSETEMAASEEASGTREIPQSELLQPSFDHTSSNESAIDPVAEQPLAATDAPVDESARLEDPQPVLAEEEFPLTKKSKKDKKKKKRQSTIDDLLDSGTSTPKEEPIPETAEPESLPQTTTQDDAQAQELVADNKPLNTEEKAELADQPQDDEWASLSTKKSKKDKKKKKKGAQTIDPEPVPEEVQPDQADRPSSPMPTSAAEALARDSSVLPGESAPSQPVEAQHDQSQSENPSTDVTEPAVLSEQEHTKNVQETPIDVPKSPIHALDPTAESAIATSKDLGEALPDVQPETDREPVPSDPPVEAQEDDFATAVSKKGKKKKKRQSVAQDSDSPRTFSFDDMMRDWQANESQATPAPEELPSTSMEQAANTQSDQLAESLGETLQGQEGIQGSRELSEQSPFGPEHDVAAQPVSSVADSHALDTETPILPDQPQMPSHQHEVPSELPEQPISVALPDQDSNSQQISNPELIADIKHITDQAGDETGLLATIQVGETVAESTHEILTEDLADKNTAQDEPSVQPAEHPEEPEISVPDSQPVAETIPADAEQDDFFMAPKSKKDKKKKKKRGQSTQEDVMTPPAVDLPSTTTANQEPDSEVARDLADEPSKELTGPQIEDAAAATPVIEDEVPSIAEPEPELFTVKKSKKDKKKKKQAASWTDDLPQDQTEATQAEAAADVVAPAEEPAADTLVQVEEPSSDLPVPAEQPVTETLDRAEDLKEDDFSGFTSSKKSKKDKKKKKQLASFGDEEVQQEPQPETQQEPQQEQVQPFDDPVQAETADDPAQVEPAPSHQEPAEAETSTPLVSAQDDEPLEFVPAKKSKKDKKKKKGLVSWDLEEPPEPQVLPEQSRDVETVDAGPSHDVDVAPVDSPIVPEDTTKDDDFSGFTSTKKSMKDKKKKRANTWEPESESQPEVLATTSNDDPLDLAVETPLPDTSLAKSGDEPTLEEHTTEVSQDQAIAATQLEYPSGTRDIPDADRELSYDIPEDRLSKPDEFNTSDVVQEPSNDQFDVHQPIPYISIEGPRDSEQHLEQRQIDEQQAEAGADEQTSTEPSTVFATPLGALTPAVQEEPRDLAEASQASPAPQEVPEAEPDLFVTKKSKKDKKKKKQASQTQDSESAPPTPMIDESVPEDQSTQATTQTTEDQTLLGSQEAAPEEAFPEFSTSKKDKKDKKKTKAGQLQDWEAETELEPESAFMTPLEEPDNQMERQLSTAPADLSSVNDQLAEADPSSSALPTSSPPAETMPAEGFPAPPESQDAFTEISSGKKSKKDKKKKRASQLQDWDAESSPASPAQEDPVISAATDVNTNEGDLVSQEAPANPEEPEASEDVFPEFTTSKKSKKDKKKAKAKAALPTPDAQEPDSFYTPFEESQQELGTSRDVQAPEAITEPAITEPAITEPSITESAMIEPAIGMTEPITETAAEPNAETTITEPVITEPATTELANAESAIAERGMTEPITETAAEPAITESAIAEPAVEPAAGPVADDLSASKDVQPDDEFPEFVSTKKSKKDKKKKKAAQQQLDWDEPVTPTPEVETQPALEIVSEAPVIDVSVEGIATADHPDLGKEIQADEEFPEFVSTKKSKKDKKKAKAAAALAAMTDLEPEASTSDPPKVEEKPTLPAEPVSVETPEIQDIAKPSLKEPTPRELEISEPRVEPAEEHKASDFLSGPSLEPVAESHDAMTTESIRAEPTVEEDNTMIIPDDTDKTVQDREPSQDQNMATNLPEATPADVVAGQPEDVSNDFPEFSVKKSTKDKKKAKKAKVAKALPREEDTPAAMGQASPFEQVPSQAEEQQQALPATETEDARGLETLHDPSTLDTQPLTEVPADITGSQTPVDVAAEASAAPEPSAFEEAEVEEFPIIRKKSKKDKKKQKAAALLASEPPSGTQTPATQEDTAAGLEVSDPLPVAEVQESTTDDLPVEEPLQLDIGGKLISEEPTPDQEATEDWPEFSSKKSKKDKKKNKSLVLAEIDPTPDMPTSSAEEAHSSRDLVDVPDVAANDVSITEQPVLEEPLQAAPADDDWPQYSTKKDKKDKKKRKATGILDSEPESGVQTPITQDMPVEESFTPAVPVPEQPAEEANLVAPTDMPEPSVPVEDDDWANFTSKKSKKDKKGKKKAKSSGSATPAEASIPIAEAPREFLSEEPANIESESSKAKDVWDDDSFFQPRASTPSPDRNAGLDRSMNFQGAVPETPMAPVASASSPAGEVDLSPAQLTSHVDHDKPFDQTTQRGKKVRTNTFLGDTEIPEPISAIEPDLVTVESDDFASRDLVEAPSQQPEVQAMPETKMEEAPSQPDRALSPSPTAREFAADYLNPGHGKHSERQKDNAASEWTPEFSTPLPQTTSERDMAVSYLESRSHKTGDASFETGDEQRKDEPLSFASQQEMSAYHVGSQSAIGEDSSRGVIVAEYPPKIDQPTSEIKGEPSAQQPYHSRNDDFAELQTKSKGTGKSTMSKDEVDKDEGPNDEETLAAAAALTGGVAMLASKFGGAKKVKGKKGKKSKYVDKRQPKEDDIFDDPMLWESEERKIVTGNDGGRIDTDTGDFWDVPDEAEEIQEDQPEKSMPKENEMEGKKSLEGGARGIPHGIIASSSELPESPIVGRDENNTREQPEMPTRETPSGHFEAPSAEASASELMQDIDELDTTEPIHSRGADASPTHDMRTQLISPSRDFGDWARSSVMSARSLPPVEEEPSEEDGEELPKPRFGNVLHTPEMNRDSGFVAESPLRRSLFDDESGNRDSGVHMKDWPEDGAKKRGSSSPTREITETASRDVKTPKRDEKGARKSQLGEEAPQLSTPTRSLGETSPDPEKKSRSHATETTKTPRSGKYGNLASGAGPALAPHAPGQQRSFSDKMTSRESSREEAATATRPRSAPRSTSNTGMSRLRTPEPLNLRPESPGGVRSSGTSTPPLRRVDKRMSGDLRSLSQHNGSATSVHSHSALGHSPHSRLTSPVPFPYPRPSSALSSPARTPVPVPAPSSSSPASAIHPTSARATKSSSDKDAQLAALQAERRRQAAASTTSSSSTPVANEGRVRAKDMTDVYDGVGEGRIGSPRSPTRPHSMRRRQSMQVLELESKVEQLMAENRVLAEARHQADNNSNQRAVVTINERDTLIEQLRSSLEEYRREVQRLKEVNEGLQSANSQLASQHSERYSHLELQHASASSTLQDKDAEIQQLRDELEATKQQVRAMQEQILATKPADADFLRLKDEDYFDNRCQQLCAHVQQWVLRFSKFSDMRASRLTSEINDVKIVDRLDNTVLDGSDVDDYLSDRVKRRDVFMSMTMHMIWEYVFTRYLFGMDREQRQKLKTLEKLLSDVGPPHAVRQWRAVTLTLLARRPAFGDQRNDDTEAVVQAILETLSKILPPPTNMENQIQSQLRRVLREAVDLSIEMRTQRAEYMMLPPLQPEYDANGDLAETVAFNAALMNERSGGSTSNEDLEANAAVVRMVLFPLVIKKGDDNGLGDDEIVVCPAQVLVAKSHSRPTRMVTPSSEFGGAPLSRGATPSVGFKSAISLPMSPAPEGTDSHMEGAI